MTTKEQFNKSKEIIREYKNNLIQSDKINKTCSICNINKIEYMDYMSFPESKTRLELDKLNWKYGTVSKVSFGYGSRYDGESYFIVICDKCISQLKKNKLIVDSEDIEKLV